MTDDFTQAEIVRSLQRIEDGMTRMRDEWQATLAEMVRRDAWERENDPNPVRVEFLSNGTVTMGFTRASGWVDFDGTYWLVD